VGIELQVCFRVDANIDIGQGHWIRCLHLATKLSEMGCQIHFASHVETSDVALERSPKFFYHYLPTLDRRNFGGEFGVDLTGLPWAERDQVDDARQMLDVCAANSIDLVIVDNYRLGAPWETIVGCRYKSLVVIDDYGKEAHICRLLVNANSITSLKDRACRAINNEPTGQTLQGIRYQIMNLKGRPGNQLAKPRKLNKDSLGIHCLLYFGGNKGLVNTERCLAVIVKHINLFDHVNIVTRCTPSEAARIEESISFYQNISLSYCPKSLESYLQEADICIGNGGISLWEKFYYRVVSIVYSANKTQVPICRDLHRLELITYMGPIENIACDQFEETLRRSLVNNQRNEKLVENMSNISLTLDGAQRVAREILGIAGGGP
jgi:spore coat polysaccharide biosynthesis predicted glycosyltransferase SpsG